MKHIKYIISVALIFAILLCSACSLTEKKNYVLKVGTSDIKGIINPFYCQSEGDKQISSQIYQPVQIRNSNNKLVNFCGGITYKIDGQKVKYTVSIDNNLFFSNGKNVTIDDVIFSYHFISDASYDGTYKDFYLNDIEGIKEYYFDDNRYSSSVLMIENQISMNYTQANISKSNLITYLVETKLAGKFTADNAPNGTSWEEYFKKYGASDKFKALKDDEAKENLLKLACETEAENNAQSYDAENWFRDKLIREYAEKNYANGISVSSISGIKKINDYTCTVQFNSMNINAVSALNVPIVSSEFYSLIYVKGLSQKVKDYYENAPGCGPYVLVRNENRKATLTANKYYPAEISFDTVEFMDYAGNEDKMFKDISAGRIDVAAVQATTNRINKLNDSAMKYYISYEDCYYSMFFNTAKLDLTERKALSGICSLNSAIEKNYGKNYTVPLRPLSVRFSEYPSSITESKYSIVDFANYQIKGARVITSLNGFCTDNFGKELLEYFKEILSEKNIKLNISCVSYEELEANIKSGKADFWIIKQYDGATSNKYDYYNTAGKYNFVNFSNAEIDELTEKINGAVGINDRTDMVRKLLELLCEQAVEHPICQLQKITVYNSETISEASLDGDYAYDYTYILSELKHK